MSQDRKESTADSFLPDESEPHAGGDVDEAGRCDSACALSRA